VVVALYARLRTGEPAAAAPQGARSQQTTLQSAPTLAAVPADFSRPPLEPATRDPFFPPAPVVPAAPAPVLATTPADPPTPPAAPAPPPLGLSFVGRLVAPDGTSNVLAAIGQDTVTLQAGRMLPNGYRVDALDEQAVYLSYPALNSTARLELPAPPTHEVR